ncbi:MAG: carbohydrate ABC transporter permease [Chloroflexi bacterium]|nr:carbohydrate ABC transporter permease [Chloroflexota bacterium]
MRSSHPAVTVTSTLLYHLVLLSVTVLMLTPFWWMTLTAFKGPGEANVYPPQLLPDHLDLGSFRQVFTAFHFPRYFANTILVSVSATLGGLLVASMAAYAFARLRFPGRDTIFFLYLGTMMIPGYVTIIPAFLVIRWLGMMDNLAALVVTHLATPFGTFLLRQYFLTIPMELEDASRIDGCSRWGFYVRILLPLSTPAVATLGLFAFMGNWNSFLWPLLVLSSERNFTLQIGLSNFAMEQFSMTNTLMAGTFLSVLPLMVLFFLTQKQFVKGIILSGLKG